MLLGILEKEGNQMLGICPDYEIGYAKFLGGGLLVGIYF